MLTKQNVSPEIAEINSAIEQFHYDIDNCLHHAEHLLKGAATLLVKEDLTDEDMVCSINTMITLSIRFVQKSIILERQNGKKR